MEQRLDKYLEQAKKIHKSVPVVDAHLDLPAEIYYRRMAGETNIIRNHYLTNWKTGGFQVIVASIFIETNILPEMGLKRMLEQVAFFLEEIKIEEEFFCLIRTKQDLEDTLASDKIGFILFLEGLDCIGDNITLIPILYELGIRGASLTWSRRNMLASGCCNAAKLDYITGGLSAAGKAAIEKMEQLGMFLDVSHLNDDGFLDVVKTAKKPFIASHSNGRNIHYNYRNLTISQIQAIQKIGGVIGINACKYLIGCHKEEGKKVIENMCDHIIHMIHIAGEQSVGFGLDLCDSYTQSKPRMHYLFQEEDGICHHGKLIYVTAALLERGVSEETLVNILSANFIQYFKQILPNC